MSKIVATILTDTPKKNDPKITGYRLVDMEILSDIIELLCCTECKSSGLKFQEIFARKKGFASKLFDAWFSTHYCRLNHTGSAGAVEVFGAQRSFNRSIEKRVATQITWETVKEKVFPQSRKSTLE